MIEGMNTVCTITIKRINKNDSMDGQVRFVTCFLLK
jgi:hypothetical protein